MTTETKTTELPVLKESSLGLVYEPAKLEVTNFEQMKQVVNSIAEKYDNQVITREMKKEAEKSRSELIAIEKSLEEERKAVKRDYNKPLQAYEAKMKELTSIINRPLSKIREGLSEVEEGERMERESLLIRHLKEKAEAAAIDWQEIEIPNNWLNKGNYTQKGVGSKLAEEIDSTIEQIIKDKKQREVNESVLRKFCETVDVEPEGWLSMLDYQSPTDIMQLIQDKLKADKERLEKFEREQKELAELEEKNAQALDVSELVEEETITNVIQVTGTISQLESLNDWLVESGIEVSEYNPNYLEDDLPFDFAPLR
ncbi:DUF1351 domain-containing protein [Atopococcus tabaci]|uniref:DUF1351 domain-containing protein n=1 Tax=Atopococcus tabaci TaxID=269774 RepID=UPI0024096F0C|nr:DUF1351 domain-containing protein [Atopococcus tabaci]